MSRENEIFSKLSELRKLIDDHSKGRSMGKVENQHQSKKEIRKTEYSDFSSILSGNDDDIPDSHKQINKKRAKSHSTQPKTQTKSKPKSVQRNTKTQKSTNHSNTKPKTPQRKTKSQRLANHSNTKTKSPQKISRKIKEFNEEEEIENEQVNELSIHRDNLHKLFSECKTLDSMIEASLSPKSVKTRSPKIQQEEAKKESDNFINHSSTPSKNKNTSSNVHSEHSKNSNKKSKTSSITSKSSQKKNNISSTPSFVSSNNQRINDDEYEEEEEVKSRNNSYNAPSYENIATNSNSSQVYVIEKSTQTQLSSSQHSISNEGSKNYSNSQHLLDVDANSRNKDIDLDLIEEEEEILSDNDEEEEANLKDSNQNELKNQATVNSKNKPETIIRTQKSKNSSESDSKNLSKPHENIIIFEKTQARSIELSDQDDNDISIEDSNTSYELNKNIAPLSSENSSSDISIEAINSNSSDDIQGQVIQSPVKTKTVKQPEFLEPIIDQTDSESEKKKQKRAPPQIKIPESTNIIKKNKNSNLDDIIDINMDLENREDIIEILATSSSDDEENTQPPNVVYSSSATPKSAKTPQFIKPVFSSESESKHTTDTDKEKEEKLSPNEIEEDMSNHSNPIYLNEDEVEIITNKEHDTPKNKVISNDLPLNISSSEPLSFEESSDDKDLILLHTTESSEDNNF